MNLIEMKGITKRFGDLVANDGVEFCLKEGEIHSLLGENGAGKSTLMKILYGMYTMEDGEIWVNGEKVKINTPIDAINLGIRMIHQNFMLIPQLTVTQNIFLGMKETGFFLKKKALEKKVSEFAGQYHFNIKPGDYIWQLSVGLKQKVEILKVLIRGVKILILDEPTSFLTPYEVDELFGSLRRMVDAGYSIIFITHKIKEVLKFCNRITVMRDGKNITTINVNEATEKNLSKIMVGRQVFLEQQNQGKKQDYGKVLFEVKNLSVLSDKGLLSVNNISFKVRAGEVLGMAGVAGNGQTELVEAIMGLRNFSLGEIIIDGESFSEIDSKKLISLGVSHIPEDKQKMGLILPFTVFENMILGSQRTDKFRRGIFISQEKIENRCKSLIEEYNIKPREGSLTVNKFSGGNQQKVVLARELSIKSSRIIIAVQPTRGLDIGATEFVRNSILMERAKGKAILLISTELEEIIAMSDRIAVIFEGSLMGNVTPDIAVEEIGLMMGGSRRSEIS